MRAAALAMEGDWRDLGGAVGSSDEFVSSSLLRGLMMSPNAAGRRRTGFLDLSREKIDVTPETKDHVWTALARWRRLLARSGPSRAFRFFSNRMF